MGGSQFWGRMFRDGETALQADCGGFDSLRLHQFFFTVGIFIVMKRKLSWRPDIPDQRDYTFSQMVLGQTPSPMATDGSNINLRYWCSAIEDQETLGSCVSNAVVGLFEFNRNYSGLGGKNYRNFSRLFNYYNSRVLNETVDEDSGTYIRDAIKSAKLNGICFEYEWPYDLEIWMNEPPLSCYRNAVNFKVSHYYRLETLDEMKTSLANFHPFVFGIAVYESFMSEQVATTGIIPLPSYRESLLGGHAMLSIGYDDSLQCFLVRNSWGKTWGIQSGNLGGYCWVPYNYLTDRNLSDDFWTAY